MKLSRVILVASAFILSAGAAQALPAMPGANTGNDDIVMVRGGHGHGHGHGHHWGRGHGRHLGWYIGRHRGWAHARHHGWRHGRHHRHW